MYSFSEKTRWCLEQAGWHDEYKANIDKYIEANAKAGCEVPIVVRKFLIQYGNLNIITPFTFEKGKSLKEMQKSGFRVINTDPILASENEYCDVWKTVTELASVEAFYPIATFNRYTTVFMNAKGEVYDTLLDGVASDSINMKLTGRSGEEFLELGLSPDTKDIKK